MAFQFFDPGNRVQGTELPLITPQESFGEDGGTVTRQFYVPWADRKKFRVRAIGYATGAAFANPYFDGAADPTLDNATDTHASNGAPATHYCLNRVNPLQLSPDEYDDWLYAKSVTAVPGPEIRGVNRTGPGGTDLESKYQDAIVNVVYTSRPYLIRDDADMLTKQAQLYQWLSDQANGTADQLTEAKKWGPIRAGAPKVPLWPYTNVPDESTLLRNVVVTFDVSVQYAVYPQTAAIKFTSGAVEDGTGTNIYRALAASLGYPYPRGVLNVTWLGVPVKNFPFRAVQALIGATNKYYLGAPRNFEAATAPALNVFGGAFPPGTLLNLYPRVALRRQANKDFVYDISYQMLYYPYGVNAAYDWITGEWREFKNFIRTIDLGPPVSWGPPAATPAEAEYVFPFKDLRFLFYPENPDQTTGPTLQGLRADDPRRERIMMAFVQASVGGWRP